MVHANVNYSFVAVSLVDNIWLATSEIGGHYREISRRPPHRAVQCTMYNVRLKWSNTCVEGINGVLYCINRRINVWTFQHLDFYSVLNIVLYLAKSGFSNVKIGRDCTILSSSTDFYTRESPSNSMYLRGNNRGLKFIRTKLYEQLKIGVKIWLFRVTRWSCASQNNENI